MPLFLYNFVTIFVITKALHAVAVVKAGVFAILKITVYVFGLDLLSVTGATTPILWVAAITIIGASLVALHQDNLKRRLAYSTISQLSYVVLGAVLANAAGITGAARSTASATAGNVETPAKKRKL